MANHLAMAATFEAGDEVLIERPTYELLVSTAQYLGAEVRYFDRRFEEGFRVSPDQVAKHISSRTRLIVLTNLHNPSGAYTDRETLLAVGEIARQNGARVLVDEVYLELFFDNRPPSAFHLGERFLSDQQSDKGVRTERSALRLGAG